MSYSKLGARGRLQLSCPAAHLGFEGWRPYAISEESGNHAAAAVEREEKRCAIEVVMQLIWRHKGSALPSRVGITFD